MQSKARLSLGLSFRIVGALSILMLILISVVVGIGISTARFHHISYKDGQRFEGWSRFALDPNIHRFILEGLSVGQDSPFFPLTIESGGRKLLIEAPQVAAIARIADSTNVIDPTYGVWHSIIDRKENPCWFVKAKSTRDMLVLIEVTVNPDCRETIVIRVGDHPEIVLPCALGTILSLWGTPLEAISHHRK